MIVVNLDKARAIAVKAAQAVPDEAHRAALLDEIAQAQTLDELRAKAMAAREAAENA